MDKLNLYLLTVTFHGGGSYVPEDPVCIGGGYYVDAVMQSIVTASSKQKVLDAVQSGMQNSKRITVKLLGPA